MARIDSEGRYVIEKEKLILPYTPFGGGPKVSGIYEPGEREVVSKHKKYQKEKVKGRLVAATSGTAASRATQERIRLRRIENAKRYNPRVKKSIVYGPRQFPPGTRAPLLDEISEPDYPKKKPPVPGDRIPTRRAITVPFPVRDPTITSEAVREVYPDTDVFGEYDGSDYEQDNRDYDNNTKPSGKPGTSSAARSPRGTTYRKPKPTPVPPTGPTTVGDVSPSSAERQRQAALRRTEQTPAGKARRAAIIAENKTRIRLEAEELAAKRARAARITTNINNARAKLASNPKVATIARAGSKLGKVRGPVITNAADLLAEYLAAGRAARLAKAQARSTSSAFLRARSVAPFPGTAGRPNLPMSY